MDKNKQAERIIQESPEINLGEREGWFKHVASSFPALRSANYRYYFTGQIISQIGTWIQIIAQSWLVLQLTNSALWVGIIAALSTLPVLIFGLFAGVLIDRYPKKRLLFAAEASAMILAFVLGVLTLTNHINVGTIAILSFFLGVVTAIDMPARQAYVIDMVGKERLTSAIALNAGVFNSARVIGPGIAGLLIGLFGTGWAFMINGFSFIAVLIALYLIKTERKEITASSNPLLAIKEGLQYAFTHSSIRMVLFFAAVMSVFGWSYSVILPVIVKNTFHQGAAGLGYFNAASGLGALIGSIVVSSFSQKIKPVIFIVSGNVLFVASILLFSFTTATTIALILLFLSGLGILMMFSTMNATIQHLVNDSFRGRVMSIYTIMFLGTAPLGSLQVGLIAQQFGTDIALRVGATVILIFGIILYLKRKNFSFH